MAKIGEGDPRWIVEDKGKEGQNVNQWHWEEKDVSNQCKDILKTMLEGVTLVQASSANGNICIKLEKVTSTTAEASLFNRKGKKRSLFDITFTVKWIGTLSDGSEANNILQEASGNINVENFTQDEKPNEYEINLTGATTTDGEKKIKEEARTVAVKVLRERLATFINEVQKLWGDSSLAAADKKAASPIGSTTSINNNNNNNNNSGNSSNNSNNNSSSNSKLGKVELTQHFRCPPNELYEFLTARERIQAFTSAAAEINGDVGTRFTIFNGAVMGENMEMKRGEIIRQRWRFNDWPSETYSEVTMKLKVGKTDDSTVLSLSHVDIPADAVERVKDGWINLYFGRMKKVFPIGMN